MKPVERFCTLTPCDAQRAATARANFKRAGMNNIVTLVEGDAHQEVSKVSGPIDILFLDADKEG